MIHGIIEHKSLIYKWTLTHDLFAISLLLLSRATYRSSSSQSKSRLLSARAAVKCCTMRLMGIIIRLVITPILLNLSLSVIHRAPGTNPHTGHGVVVYHSNL